MSRKRFLVWASVCLYLLFSVLFARALLAVDDNAFLPPSPTSAVDGKQVRFPDKLIGSPVTSATLTPDINYVIESDDDGVVLARPMGLVRVTKETGPLRIRGRFIDSPPGSRTETRTYKGPNIFIVDAIGTGTVDLSFIPFGFKSETDIVSRVVPVDMGNAPKPPPDNDPDPKPLPPEPTPKAELLWIIVVEETGERTPVTIAVLTDTGYWNKVKAQGHRVVFYDRDQQEAKNYGYVKRAQTVGLPAVIFYDQKTHAHLKTIKLPLSTSALEVEIKGLSK